MDLSVIVPAFNEEASLASCLKAIKLQKTKASFELIVCDTGSTDRTPQIAKEYADVFVTTSERSPAAGRNTGASKATGEYLLFIDADTIIPPGFLQGVYEKFINYPKLLGFSTSFIFSKKTKKLVFTAKITNSYLHFRDTVGLTTLTGFNIAVRRDAFNLLGGFRDVPLEDGEFSIRLRKIGKVRYFQDLYVVTSSRRLEDMGLLGTIRYYLEMDLATKDPQIGRLLKYTQYIKCNFNDLELQKEFERVFSTPQSTEVDATIEDYIQKSAEALANIIDKTKVDQLTNRITEMATRIAELKLRAPLDKADVDRAVKLIKEKIR